ncbi:hypothetical protein BR93DRAFT_228342 [Coniochaeta sp. PMI_546]|nr:hypothetical protein BR93DRAFT_228342 [Coniochaeta sp. PMI_546]
MVTPVPENNDWPLHVSLAASTSIGAREEESGPTIEKTGPNKRRVTNRRRLRCTRKGCSWKAPSTSMLEIHLKQHQKCPNPDCPWEEGWSEKDKRRHVGTNHEKWALQCNYPIDRGECPFCDKSIRRSDNLNRHIQTQH